MVFLKKINFELRDIVARSRNHFYSGKGTMLSLLVDFHVAVNNVKLSRVSSEVQKCVFLVLLSCYKIFRVAVNNTNVLMSSCKVPDIAVRF